MTKIKILAWLMIALGLNSCKTYQPDNLPATQLRFGSGGGFTGAMTEYLLLENGQVLMRKSLEADFQSQGKIKKAKAKAMFKDWESHAFSEKEFQHPGNMYYFVTIVKEGEEHRLTWGSNDHPASDELKTFYKSCGAMLKEMDSAEKGKE